MRTITTIAAALLLAGCTASDQLPFQYVKGERVLIQRESPDNPEIKGLRVAFHPTKNDFALVEPWNALSMIIRASPPGRWLAQIDEHRRYYDGALVEALEQRGKRNCVVEKADLHPERYMIEYTYRCG